MSFGSFLRGLSGNPGLGAGKGGVLSLVVVASALAAAAAKRLAKSKTSPPPGK